MKLIKLDHKELIEEQLKKYEKVQSELNFTNLFAWREKYNFHFITINDTILIVNIKGDSYYLSEPLGHISPEIIDEITTELNLDQLFFKKCSKGFVDDIKKLNYDVTYESVRDDYDYLYDMLELKELKGNKYHKKKNHVNQFIKLYNYHYEDLREDRFDDIHHIMNIWFKDASEELLAEKVAIDKVLKHWSILNTCGGILYVDDQPVAFTIGEYINDDTLLIHFEKADTSYKSVYTMMTHQFILHQPLVKYVNREQDLGIPGLRKSKLSYHPIEFIEKYNVIVKGSYGKKI
jgi:hypothetical protein